MRRTTATQLTLAVLLTAGLAPQARATLPAPDVLIYGTVTAGGETVSQGTMTAVLPGELEAAATFVFDPDAEDPRYVVRMPMEALAPAGAGRGLEGTVVSLYLDGVAVGAVTLEAPGSTRELDLDADAGELDPDGDGLTTADELGRGTDPFVADTDGDGIPDGYEVLVDLNPTDPTDAGEDPDGNGLTHLQEYLGVTGGGNAGGIPTAQLDVTQGQATTGTLDLSNLGESTYSLRIVTPPSHGVATVAADGVLRYTYLPDLAYVGLDAMTVRVTNSSGNTWDVPVTIEVYPDADAPERPALASLDTFTDAASPHKVLLVDMNGDGHLDLVVADAAAGRVCTYLATGGALTLHETADTGSELVDLAAASLDGDATPDLIAATTTATALSRAAPATASDQLAVLLNDGSGSLGTPTRYLTGQAPVSVAVGDVNNDGYQDAAVAHVGSEEVNVHLGDGAGKLRLVSSVAVGSAPSALVLADLNGDGHLDLAVSDAGENAVSVLLGDGSGGFAASSSAAVGTAPPAVAVGDLDRNGIADLAVANAGSGDVSVLLGRGDGTFAPTRNYALGGHPRVVALVDVLGDGDLDLVILDADGRLVTLMGDGAGGFSAAVLEALAGTPAALALGDLDGDGVVDVAVADEDGSEVTVYRTVAQWQGTPTSSEPPATGNTDSGGGGGGCFMRAVSAR